MKYSDIIRLQDYLPIYDIMAEMPNAWKQFIPTKQFCDLLSRSLTAMTSGEPSKRKSMWVRGAFGTGKSHASAVVKHLLCDNLESLEGYISNIEDVQLRERIRNIRKLKRFFAVTLKGVENAYDIPHFSLALQRKTQEEIAKVDPSIIVKSDFTTAIEWIESHRDTFETAVLSKDEDLQGMVSNVDQTIALLKSYDTTVYQLVEEALTRHLGPVLQHSKISEWLVEVQQKLKERGIADGLVVFWDEFTSVMDTLKSDRINVLQNIAEKSQQNNVFLFLISHRTEDQSHDTRTKDISKMSDRFDSVEYTMDSISTYLIMRHSLMIPEQMRPLYESLHKRAFASLLKTIEFLAGNKAEEKLHIEKLFPLHPFTAYLCSTLSNHIGSSNRTVVKYMHDEDMGFAKFIIDDQAYENNRLLTADSLWDFFLPEFDRDPKSTAFTSTYNSYEDKVKRYGGDDYLRVFKAILLLNALAPKFGKGNATTEKLQPNKEVIGYIFAGDPVNGKLSEILDFLHDNNIVNRNIFDEYKISASNYNQGVLNDEKRKQEANFSHSTRILEYDIDSKKEIVNLFNIGPMVKRETDVLFLACEMNESLIKSYIHKFAKEKPNYVHVVIFSSLSEFDRDSKIQVLKNISKDYDNTVLVQLEETFTRDYFTKFIDALAIKAIATQQHQNAEAEEYEKHAHQFVKNWVTRALNGTYTLFYLGEPFSQGVLHQINDVLNDKYAPRIFSSGFEKVKGLHNVTSTFFQAKGWLKVLQQVLEGNTREKIMQHSGAGMHIQEIFRENGNLLLTAEGNLSEYAMTSGAWIVEIQRLMDKCMSDAKKKYRDRFSLGDILAPFANQPYGFFSSYVHNAALAYTIRKHKADLFMPSISQPISNDKLADYLNEILEMWKRGCVDKQTDKWMLRFGSPEENQLTKLLVDVFELKKIAGTGEIKSLDNAKWYFQEFCKVKAKYPLWVLKHADLSEEINKAIISILTVFDPTSTPSIEKIKEAYKVVSLNHVELNILLTNPTNYQKGFVNFVNDIKEVEIKPEWWDEMIEEVNTLQEEVAFRRETDVRQRIVQFYIRKIKKPSNPKSDSSIIVSDPPLIPKIDYVTEAKNKIKNANMPNMFWQKLVLDLISERPDVAEFWSKSL